MKLQEIILTRRTIHAYTRDPVPREILMTALECAMYAPNHRLTFPWRFFRLGEEARAVIADLQVELKKLSGAPAQAMREKMRHEGELLVVANVRPALSETVDATKQAEIENEDYASLACALQNMALYLWNEGYGTKWSTGAITRHDKIYELLQKADHNVNCDNLRLCGFFWIGRPAGRIPVAPKRPDVGQVFRELK